MYLTAHRVFLRSTSSRGINAFLYRHDDAPYPEIDWRNPDVPLVADAVPGRLFTQQREIAEPGGEVLSYLDIVAEDQLGPDRIEAALERFADPTVLLDPRPFTDVEGVGIRFSAVLGLRSVPAKYHEEFIALRESAMNLLRASGTFAQPCSK
jgi:hypothetical protein